MIPDNFGRQEGPSIGVEEELFVVDAGTYEPVPFPQVGFDGSRLKSELFRSVVELNTGICASAEEAAAELGELRGRARSIAAEAGASLAATGTWPLAVPEEQEITSESPYLRFVEFAGSSARRQYCSGLHVHLGMSSWEACLNALEALLPWLPLVLAVSANSPYLAGRETGLASNRAELLALLPRSGAPPHLADRESWERFVGRLLDFGLADDYTRIWWDVRPHPRFGTLEVRMPDQPTRLEASAALVALIDALARTTRADGPADRGIYAENRWAAFRFGRAARLIHPGGTRLATVPELLDELAGIVGDDVVDPLRELDQAGEQLEVGRRQGIDPLCGRLVALT
jgi:glutamate---cysteine ligase / carboxylate-amine ligase